MRKHQPIIYARAQARLGTYGLRPSNEGEESTIYLYDVITPYADEYWGGVSAADFVQALNELTTPVIHLRINSPGGDVFDARAMATAIRNHPSKIIAHIDGLAASAASYVAIACDTVRMAQGAMVMIHRAWTFTAGNTQDLRKEADVLEKIDGTIADDYASKGSESGQWFLDRMDAETWLTLDECMQCGLVDEKDETQKVVTNSVANEATDARAKAWIEAMECSARMQTKEEREDQSAPEVPNKPNIGAAAHARARALALQ